MNRCGRFRIVRRIFVSCRGMVKIGTRRPPTSRSFEYVTPFWSFQASWRAATLRSGCLVVPRNAQSMELQPGVSMGVGPRCICLWTWRLRANSNDRSIDRKVTYSEGLEDTTSSPCPSRLSGSQADPPASCRRYVPSSALPEKSSSTSTVFLSKTTKRRSFCS